jgi:hypothetical protein
MFNRVQQKCNSSAASLIKLGFGSIKLIDTQQIKT